MTATGLPPKGMTPPERTSRRAERAYARRRGRLASPLTWRILAVNLLAPLLLVGGLLYVDRYKQELVAAELASLRIRAEMFAAAVAEGAVTERPDQPVYFEVFPEIAQQMVRRLADSAGVRARLYGTDGDLLADNRSFGRKGKTVIVEELPPPDSGIELMQDIRRARDMVATYGLGLEGLPALPNPAQPTARDYPEVAQALAGDASGQVRRRESGELVLSVAVPVQRYKQVVGAIHLQADGMPLVHSLIEVRMAILQVFAVILLITVGLSLYLAGTIARPVRRLAMAAERVRRGHGRHAIPDLSGRGDEIGDLSQALRDMTEALWRRMDAIEAFAADVAHEIKNPLTSLRSAVETVARVKDPGQRDKLMAIIQDDVGRLDRLISDISDASRLDAELSRAEVAPVNGRRMLETLAEVYRSTGPGAEGRVRFTLDLDQDDDLMVPGLEGRLVQVFRNLIANAISFSPEGGEITLAARRDGRQVRISVSDQGPGIPENKLDAIFERFYTERPQGEKFGTHSGLGLSISKQIVDAHGGTITARNRIPTGAEFTVTLPAG